MHLTTFFSEIFCFSDFFWDGMGQDGTGRTDPGTDRLFLENIILDVASRPFGRDFLGLNQETASTDFCYHFFGLILVL